MLTHRRVAAEARRYRELLPIGSDEDVVSLGEGMSPYCRSAPGRGLRLRHVWVKDEGSCPREFKARGIPWRSTAKRSGVLVLAHSVSGQCGRYASGLCGG